MSKNKKAEIQEWKTTAKINEKNLTEALNETIKQYTSEIDKLKVAVSDFNLKEIRYLDEINELKCELSNTMYKYTETLQLQQEIKTESEKLSQMHFPETNQKTDSESFVPL